MEPQKTQISQESGEKKRTKPKKQNNAGGFTIPDLEVRYRAIVITIIGWKKHVDNVDNRTKLKTQIWAYVTLAT